MDKPIRVAQVIGMACNGGVEAVIMNYYKYIDKSKVQFDFLVESESKIINKEEIEKMGGRIIIIPSYKNVFKYMKELKKIFKENKYDIVHSNMNTLSIFSLRAAKKAGVKVRIAHSHSTSNKKEWKRNILKNILRPFSKVYATHYFACGELAGRYLFGNRTFNKGKVTIVNNAIETERFKFNEEVRKEVRKELNVEDKFVIGHIGRFMTQKNHTFLIDIFNDVSKEREDAVLLLVGEGPLKEEIEQKVKELDLEQKVIFLGVRQDCDKLYQAMDVFVLPSLYEGLPVVGVEAQCSGVKCLFSDKVTKEVSYSSTTDFIKLDIEKWKNKILNLDMSDRKIVTNDAFDIEKSSENLVDKYSKIIDEAQK